MNGPLEKRENLALECINLSKRFGGLDAVSKVNLQVMPGERRAILGPNGAGKTTFFRLISGEFPVSSGSIRYFGRDITHMACHRRTHLGLGRTFQITNLFPTLTVLDNLVLAAMGLKTTKFSMLRPLSTYRNLNQKAMDLLDKLGMTDRKEEIIKNLSHGEQREIEIALALISNPRLLLLDEPTAGLSAAESAMIAQTVQRLDRSITILIIEHDMDVAFSIADRITVLHQGCLFAEGSQAEIQQNTSVQAIYFGTEEKPC
jgi:branched-chain amino acid transport system ATP-binding protein